MAAVVAVDLAAVAVANSGVVKTDVAADVQAGLLGLGGLVADENCWLAAVELQFPALLVIADAALKCRVLTFAILYADIRAMQARLWAYFLLHRLGSPGLVQ